MYDSAPEHWISGLAFVDHAEEVAVGVFKDSEIIIWVIRLTMTLSTQLKQPLHLTLSVAGIEVKVQPVSTHEPLRNLIQGYVRASSFRVTKNHPAALSWLSWDVVKGFLPERQHLVEVDAVDDDGANLQLRFFGHFRSPKMFLRSLKAALEPHSGGISTRVNNKSLLSPAIPLFFCFWMKIVEILEMIV